MDQLPAPAAPAGAGGSTCSQVGYPSFMRICFTAAMLVAAASAANVDFAALDKYATEQLAANATPGMAVAVVMDHKVVYSRAFGVANAESWDSATPEMLFRLGSTTKMFTAAALLTLADQGKLDLAAPIGRYVHGLAPAVARVTVHQLLSHTAGIRDMGSATGSHDDDALAKRIRGFKDSDVTIEPGAIISYSSPGFWVAGLVLEEITGKPFADAVNELVFKPVGMSRSTFRPLVAMTYPLAIGHGVSQGGKPGVLRPFADDVSTWPGGSMFSNVSDLARFVIAFMDGGKLDGRQVIPASVVDRMSQPHAPLPGSADLNYTYGLMLSRVQGLRVLSHGGARSGYGSTMVMIPERGFAVIVLANRTSATMAEVADRATEIALRIKEPPPAKPQAIPMSADEAAAYAGRFADPDMAIELIAKGDKLVLKYLGHESPVTKVGEGRFRVEGPPAPEFILVRGKDGSWQYFHAELRTLPRSGAPGAVTPAVVPVAPAPAAAPDRSASPSSKRDK